WLLDIAAALRPRTVAGYSDMLRLYILPPFGAMKLRDLHRAHIKGLLARKRAEGLSKNTTRLIRATLSVLLGDAVEDGIILANPALQVGRRGRKRAEAVTVAERQKKIRPMSYEQLATLLAMAETECSRPGAVLFLLLADTGVRPGEALAVQWEDVD